MQILLYRHCAYALPVFTYIISCCPLISCHLMLHLMLQVTCTLRGVLLYSLLVYHGLCSVCKALEDTVADTLHLLGHYLKIRPALDIAHHSLEIISCLDIIGGSFDRLFGHRVSRPALSQKSEAVSASCKP